MNDEPWHGTRGGYTNHHCRCDACRAALAQAVRVARARRKAAPTPDYVHGTTNGYSNYGCRCTACRTAHADYAREHHRRR